MIRLFGDAGWDAQSAVEGAAAVDRVLLLDDIWTGALGLEIRRDDRGPLVEIGHEMRDLLQQLSGQADDLERLAVSAQGWMLDGTVDRCLDVVADSDHRVEVPFSIDDLKTAFRELASQIPDALATLRDPAEDLAALNDKADRIASGEDVPGDLSERMRTALKVVKWSIRTGGVVVHVAEIGGVAVAPPLAIGMIVVEIGGEYIIHRALKREPPH